MEPVTFTYENAVVLGLLGLTIVLFVSEIVRIDHAAILVMVLLGLVSYLPGLENIADVNQLFTGFSSNAVISIIAVMIIGAGLDRTGVMNSVAAYILKIGGKSEARIIPVISGTVGVISSFMQNVGAAALFLPVVSRISSRSGLSMSRLLMPMGFCAILGGTLTMVGSSPMILLNDLMMIDGEHLEPFTLFAPLPIGLALIVSGVLYFVLLGRWVLPSDAASEHTGAVQAIGDYLKQTYKLKSDLIEVRVPEGNILVGNRLEDIMYAHSLYIIGTSYAGNKVIAPRVTTEILTPCRLAILGRRKVIEDVCEIYGLEMLPELDDFAEDFAPTKAGIAELVIPPGSGAVGKTPQELRFRNTYGMSLLAVHRGADTMSHVETEDHPATQIGLVPFQAGDTLVVHTPWALLSKMRPDRDYVIVTNDFPEEDLRPQKLGWAAFFFFIAIGLVLFSDLRLSLCLLVGAMGMISTRVLSLDEAYEAVSWTTVFLLASLIPLGMAVQDTGTAAWIAQNIIALLDGWPTWALQVGLALLATGFTLVMSNVGATVLLVPLAISIAQAADADPRIFALTVAISTSNSFLIPTHQVNALIMGPAGYSVKDFLRSGSIMTILFLVVSMTMLNVVY